LLLIYYSLLRTGFYAGAAGSAFNVINPGDIVDYVYSVKFTGLFAKFAGYAAYRANNFDIFTYIMGTTGYMDFAVYWRQGEKLFRTGSNTFVAGFAFSLVDHRNIFL
jgi:hypothetical protein